MIRVQERSAKTFTVTFRNASGVESAPSTARWRLWNVTTKEVVADWTSITPATSATITTTSEHNKIRGGNKTERLELVVQSDYDNTSAAQSRAIQYEVVNLASVAD